MGIGDGQITGNRETAKLWGLMFRAVHGDDASPAAIFLANQGKLWDGKATGLRPPYYSEKLISLGDGICDGYVRRVATSAKHRKLCDAKLKLRGLKRVL